MENMSPSMEIEAVDSAKQKKLVQIVYGLFAAALLIQVATYEDLLALVLGGVGVAIAYIKRARQDQFSFSHFRWQIVTFWVWLVLSVLTFSFTFIISLSTIYCAYGWMVYRLVKGFLCLHEGKLVGKLPADEESGSGMPV